MNRYQWGLLAIVATALIVFAVLSFWPDGLGGMKTASFAKDLGMGKKTEVPKPVVDSVTEVVYQPGKMPLDTAAKNILFMGDSMLEGLGPRMAAYAQENGHNLTNVMWYGSTSEVWGTSPRLEQHLKEQNPDFIIISLGGNELFVKDIKEKRQKYIDTILKAFGSIPYVWIGPPNWKPDTGINEMLEASCAPGTFYLSNGEHFVRAKDGAHPTRKSAAEWCDRICNWIMTKSAHPIRMNTPSIEKGKCKVIMYRPPGKE